MTTATATRPTTIDRLVTVIEQETDVLADFRQDYRDGFGSLDAVRRQSALLDRLLYLRDNADDTLTERDWLVEFER